MTFKSQCEKSDEILRTTFKCEVNRKSVPSTGEQFVDDFSGNIVDDKNDDNVIELENALSTAEVDESNANEPEDTKDDRLTVCDKPNNDVYEVILTTNFHQVVIVIHCQCSGIFSCR